jgi:hypothetical protein
MKFSLKRLLASLTLIAVGIGINQVPDRMGCGVARMHGPPLSEPVQWMLCLGGAALFGAGIGNIAHRPKIGAVAGIAIYYFACIVWSMSKWH